jgi:protocatechuate 3,4-dioxygenase alpha subunit
VKGTPAQTVGPFFRFGMEWLESSEPAGAGISPAIELRGAVHDAEGLVPDALIELWGPPRFVRVLTDANGGYRCWIHKPAPAGDESAPHLDVSVFGRGLLQRLVTRIYFPDESAANLADPVLALVPEHRRRTLVARPGPGCLVFDVRLRGPDETVFFAY